jgi:iron complex outermembrane receptor protein
MKKIIALSLICATSLIAEDLKLEAINVNSTTLSDVSHEQIESADLADALQKASPDISLTRRSGIANDIILRGMRKDDINVLVDGTKTYGACPNRMDPAISHVLANNIESIHIVEGPYDVQNFGTLSGLVAMQTKAPEKDFHAELDLGAGSFAYRKAGVTLSGGNDLVRVMVSGSAETSGQYEDGNGNNFNEQMIKANAPLGNRLQAKNIDMQAYEKKTLKTKAFINPTDNQELRLSFTANRSDGVLYPSTPMDADYDNSNIYDVAYDIKNLGDFSKKLTLQYYASDVDHPMSTQLRNSGASTYTTAHLTTNTQGVKVKDAIDIAGHELVIGVDGSKRNWDGNKYNTVVATGVSTAPTMMIPDVYTDNAAVFSELSKSYGDFSVKLGLRYDSTTVKTNVATNATIDYTALSANMLTNYDLSKNNKLIFGFGKSSRVPDAKELYIAGSGNKNLDQVTNYEADLGLENSYDSFVLKTKAFYSKLYNYVIFDAKSATTLKYQNIDASIYGLSINGSYFITNSLTLDAGAAYQVGHKDTLAVGQSDRDLPNITPLKGNLALTYAYKKDSYIKAQTVATDAWSRYDSDDGEQALKGWSTLNLKLSHAFNKYLQLDIGVDNVLNTTYAISNTYKDLTLLSSTPTAPVMLLNEPGRYIYTNLTIKY